EVVGLDVEQDGDTRPQLVHVLELEARQLADDPAVGGEQPVERAQRPPDVAGDRRLAAVRPEHRPEELARRRLAVRPGHAQERLLQDPEAELDLAPDGIPRARASRTSAFSPGTPGLLTTRPAPSRSDLSSSVPWLRSAATTSTPRRSSAAAAARPERAMPRTSTRGGSSGRVTSSPGRPRPRARRPQRGRRTHPEAG